jgi:hypothetical protein
MHCRGGSCAPNALTCLISEIEHRSMFSKGNDDEVASFSPHRQSILSTGSLSPSFIIFQFKTNLTFSVSVNNAFGHVDIAVCCAVNLSKFASMQPELSY